MFITIEAKSKLHGNRPLNVNKLVKLVKDPNNKYDDEAIACETRHFGKIGYVSNSVNTVFKGTMSAGRVIDKIGNIYFAKIQFTRESTAIAKILSFKEYQLEMDNEESEIHYLCENLDEIDTDYIERNYME